MIRKIEMRLAETVQNPEKLVRRYWEPEFWFGYHRGLNRRNYGKVFGSNEEHRSWHDIPNNLEEEPSIERVAYGIGYRAGNAGMNVEEAAEKIRELMRGLKEKYGIEETDGSAAN